MVGIKGTGGGAMRENEVMKKVRPEQEEEMLKFLRLFTLSYEGLTILQELKLEELSKKMEENWSVIFELKEELKVYQKKVAEMDLDVSTLQKENKELKALV